VGVSRSNVINALDALAEIGLLLQEHRFYPESKRRKASMFRVNLDMLFDSRPSRELTARQAGEGKQQRIGPASETNANGPASETTVVLPARPLNPVNGPASRTYILKTINTSHTTARCPQCLTVTWRRAETGEVLCALCNCEQFGHPELRPQVDEMLKKRRLLR
jgi:ribosomal protein L37AE/L43A